MNFKASDIMGFGKYKELTVKEVLDEDPSYLVWARDTIDWFNISNYLYNKAKSKTHQHKVCHSSGADWANFQGSMGDYMGYGDPMSDLYPHGD
jgi:hypothetical protein